MIREIQNTLRPHGERDTMLNRKKLTHEILGLFGISVAISVFFYAFLSRTANSIVEAYIFQKDILLTETQQWMLDAWIPRVSFVAATFLFVFLFLFLMGQRLQYIKVIIGGIEALRMHRMDYEIPLEWNNELTELAERINLLARTEKELQIKENLLQEEREGFIRAMSHDIRTPLTVIKGYSEYMQKKEVLTEKEIRLYAQLIDQKAGQLKEMTDRLLNGGRALERIENGRFLMEQLVSEWEMMLEDEYTCNIDMSECPEFAGEFDIQEFRRVFDNLASNVKKYADTKYPVELTVLKKEGFLVIEQMNHLQKEVTEVESNGIGLENIQKIVEQYKGSMDIEQSLEFFRITLQISL